MENHHDELYDTIKKEVLKGKKHLPYKEYIKGRTLVYIEKFATLEDIAEIERALDRRSVNESTLEYARAYSASASDTRASD